MSEKEELSSWCPARAADKIARAAGELAREASATGDRLKAGHARLLAELALTIAVDSAATCDRTCLAALSDPMVRRTVGQARAP